MNADGSSITQLTHTFRNHYDPTWSPQGNKIVFTHSDSAAFKAQQIYVMNPDGTGISPITYDSLAPTGDRAKEDGDTTSAAYDVAASISH